MKIIRTLSGSSFPSLAGFLLGVFTILVLSGCQQSGHTSDPRFKQIDEMLDSQLPPGTAKSRAAFYLSSQNFPVENTPDPREIVAIVHHVDTDTLLPATARVTFHFDARDNLKSYELATAAGAFPQQ